MKNIFFLIFCVLLSLNVFAEIEVKNITNFKQKIDIPSDKSFLFKKSVSSDSSYYSEMFDIDPFSEYFLIKNVFNKYISFKNKSNLESVYTIKTLNGEIVELNNTNTRFDYFFSYAFLGYFRDINSFVFSYREYEGWAIVLVNLETGQTTYLDEMPSFFSNNKKYFLLAPSDNVSNNGIKIYKIEENGEITDVLGDYAYSDECSNGCRIIKFDDNKIVVNFKNIYQKDDVSYNKVIDINGDNFFPREEKIFKGQADYFEYNNETPKESFDKINLIKVEEADLDKIKNNKEAVLEIIPKYQDVYKSLSENLKEDRDIANAFLLSVAITEEPSQPVKITFLPSSLYNDKIFVEKFIKNFPSGYYISPEYCSASEEVRSDKKFILELYNIYKWEGQSIYECTSEKLKNDKDFLLQ